MRGLLSKIERAEAADPGRLLVMAGVSIAVIAVTYFGVLYLIAH